MNGIAEIGVYVPNNYERISDKKLQFNLEDDFLINKIGINKLSRKNITEDTSDMCIKAFSDLITKIKVDKLKVDCLILVTQNPDNDGLPHTSSVIHNKLGLSDSCACFDISLGCSGYVYGLGIIESFMHLNKLECGLLFTCDPYSKIVDKNDRNTSFLFGDAASVTLINNFPKLIRQDSLFATRGSEGNALFSNNKILFMDGRSVFNFSATEVPKQINQILDKNNLKTTDVDLFFLHQGSKYIVDTITKRLSLKKTSVPLSIAETGNTISSTIPLMLTNYINNNKINTILMSGFGVGLSWATSIYKRKI
jgi:3-oxoacyl-[acyl-carrier-protein] synthase-3